MIEAFQLRIIPGRPYRMEERYTVRDANGAGWWVSAPVFRELQRRPYRGERVSVTRMPDEDGKERYEAAFLL